MRLIGDIGGTNVRFATVENGQLKNIKKFLKKDFHNITDAINKYISLLEEKPNEAVIAVNTPVIGNKPHAGNNDWGYKTETLNEDTGIKKIVFMNDLVAHAMSIPHVEKEEKYKLHGKAEINEGPMAIVGPGTGLGVSYGLFDKQTNKYEFFPSEGGAQIVSVANTKQIDIINKMLKKQPFIRWEELTSGKGIAHLYEALFDEKKTTEVIMQELYKGSKKSLEVFNIVCEFLGILIRNVATTFLPTGGIYIIGGIFNRKENLEILKASDFMNYYNFTAPYKSTFIKDYPIYVITHPNSAFIGLANYKF